MNEDATRLRRLIWLGQGAMERMESHHREHHKWEGSPEWTDDRRVLRGLMALAEAEDIATDVLACAEKAERALAEMREKLEAVEAERDNLDDNLSRVQRHLQHAVRKLDQQ